MTHTITIVLLGFKPSQLLGAISGLTAEGQPEKKTRFTHTMFKPINSGYAPGIGLQSFKHFKAKSTDRIPKRGMYSEKLNGRGLIL